jgi:hypothetical protein
LRGVVLHIGHVRDPIVAHGVVASVTAGIANGGKIFSVGFPGFAGGDQLTDDIVSPKRSVAFRGGEAWRVRCSSRFGGGVHLILANPPWRQLQERAEKIPGDKKHMKGILSQSQCVAQFNTAQNRLTGQLPGRSRGSKVGHAPRRWANLR